MSRLRDRFFGPDWGIRSIGGYSSPDSPENRGDIATLAMSLLGALGVTIMLAWLMIPLTGSHPAGTNFAAFLIILSAGFVVLLPSYWFSRNRIPLWLLHLYAAAVFIELAVSLFLVGPALSLVMAVGSISLGTLAFLLMRWQIASLYVLPLAAISGVAFNRQPSDTAPWSRWIATVGGMAIISGTVAWLANRNATLAARERASREVTEELNRTLEERVTEQVNELDRMSKLRRFLSPQIADNLLAADDESLLQPHRRQIAVFYCDLRGFTRFSSGAEPEDVVDILGQYYAAVGGVIRKYGATLGSFAGDGIMAYFNDPVPCEDPAYIAVQMALELRGPMTSLLNSWKADGYDLGYGVGVTYGYATLGMIGFESRNDYSAIGTVVNLAARLCAEAQTGQILVDSRTMKAVGERITGIPRDLTLKGIPDTVTAYLVGEGSLRRS